MSNNIKIDGIEVVRDGVHIFVSRHGSMLYRVIWNGKYWEVHEREHGDLAAMFLRGPDAVRWIKRELLREVTRG